MAWFGNSKQRRAFKVVRRRKESVRLRDAHGMEFMESLEKLERNGYRLLANKPAYAGRGGY